MGIFTREEKMDMKKGKWITTRRGLPKFRRSHTPVYDKFQPQIKKYEIKEQEIKRRKKQIRSKMIKKKRDVMLERLENISKGFE